MLGASRPPDGWHDLHPDASPSATCHSAAAPWAWLFTAFAALALAARRRRAPVWTLALAALLAAALPMSCADPGAPRDANAIGLHLEDVLHDRVNPDGTVEHVSVDTFDPHTLRWGAQWLEQVNDGQVFLFEGALYRRSPSGFSALGPVHPTDLEHADATVGTFEPPAVPTASDWVLVFDEAGLTHARLDHLRPGTRIAYDGWLYDTQGTTHIQAVRATGQALARVRHPHRRIAPQTHVLTVRSDDGATFEVQGTEEHPFWSPDEDAWVPMAELVPGDALSADGVRSVVLDRRVVDGDVEVFNVEVDGLHNYVVVGEDGGVVVHNGGCGSAISPQARGRISEARVLDDLGLKKNTQKVSGSEGNSVPDAITPDMVVEVKDTQRVSNTRQLRIQREYATTSGRKHTVVTGKNTRVSHVVTEESIVIRRSDLGPK